MLCRVCKRELGDSPVCSFCGEDNTPYIQAKEDVKKLNEAAAPKAEAKAQKEFKVKSNYKINYKKLARFVIIILLIILIPALIINVFFSLGHIIIPHFSSLSIT